MINALNTGGQGLVGEEDHRHLVALGHIEGQHHQGIAIRNVGRGDNHTGSVAVTHTQRETQVGLLHLGRHARAGAGALRIDDHRRYLRHRCKAEGLAHQREARAGGGRHGTRAAK